MPTVKIFTDSTSDLPGYWQDRYDIGVIPLYVVFGNDTRRDGIEITPDDVYRQVAAEGALPKTAAPSPADFIRAFAPAVEQGRDVVYLSLSSSLSSTYQNALIAAGEFPEGRVHVVDSESLCGGIALLAVRAARAAENGAGAASIVSALEDERRRLSTEFVVDTLDYLYMGGRCSGMANFIGSLLKIRPVLRLVEGKILPIGRIRGKKEKAVEQMLNHALENLDVIDRELIIVAHTQAPEDAEFLRRALQESTGAREIAVIEAGCVIGSHCGPHTVGLMFLKS
ncbi:DegV family protein [Paenibacillus spiritus]|uniref:DegV family protein n=1 Tax=Paenibacillus spiritus TaxID=2496557 RepID=A0A5J5FZI5_9BACL|nr:MULTISPECIES: DegV family protein [Paenibacillus]KAA8999659.1 DegV family protein [Paenibacillus spiritus]